MSKTLNECIMDVRCRITDLQMELLKFQESLLEEKLWIPKGGTWSVSQRGGVINGVPYEKARVIGNEYQTCDQAKRAASQRTNRELMNKFVIESNEGTMFVANHNGPPVTDRNHSVYYAVDDGCWRVAICDDCICVGVEYSNGETAYELAMMLNERRIEGFDYSLYDEGEEKV